MRFDMAAIAFARLAQLCQASPRVERQLIMPGAVPASTSTSSYDYWWPYPPGGTSSIAAPSSSPTPMPEALVTDTSPILTFALPSDLTTELSSSTDATDISSGDTSSISPTSTSANASSLNTSTSLPTVITISATSSTVLPTLVTYPKKNPDTQSPKIVYYLIPVFAVVGIILGSVCAWVGWGCWTRRARGKQEELEVGPAYGSREWEDRTPILRCDAANPNPVLTPPYLEEKDHSPWNDVETASFLSPPEPSTQTRRALPKRQTRNALSRAATAKTATSMSVYSQVDDDENDESMDQFLSDYESDDQDDLRSTRRRNPHVRQNSDCAPVQREKSNASTLASGWGWSGLSAGLGREKSVGEQSLGGFRIVQESPLPTPSINKVFSWGKEQEQVGDTYTELPRRGSRSRSPVKGRSSPVKRTGPPASGGGRGVDRGETPFKRREMHPLPQSPRQLMSPKLEGALCFTPKIDQGGRERFQSMAFQDDSDLDSLKL